MMSIVIDSTAPGEPVSSSKTFQITIPRRTDPADSEADDNRQVVPRIR